MLDWSPTIQLSINKCTYHILMKLKACAPSCIWVPGSLSLTEQQLLVLYCWPCLKLAPADCSSMLSQLNLHPVVLIYFLLITLSLSYYWFERNKQEFVRSSRSRRRYWARSYAGWRRFTAAQPSAAHYALASLEKVGRVNLMVTQNVDRWGNSFFSFCISVSSVTLFALLLIHGNFRLHHRAGSNPLELHGTVYTVICLDCSTSISRELFQEQVKALNPKVWFFFKNFFSCLVFVLAVCLTELNRVVTCSRLILSNQLLLSGPAIIGY